MMTGLDRDSIFIVEGVYAQNLSVCWLVASSVNNTKCVKIMTQKAV